MPLFSPSTKSVQKQYVDKRLRQIHRDPEQERYAAVEFVIREAQRRHGVGEPWENSLKRIVLNLQRRELTINLDAGSWFKAPNDYDTYTQMYERGVTPTGVVLKSNELNPAIPRAVVDDLVTLPEDWASANPWTERRRLYDALTMTGAKLSTTSNVLQPKDTPHIQKLDPKGKSITTTNASFKPRAKQVFAALNYGKRPNGSSTAYGFSYMVLAPNLKQRSMYYAGDTFHSALLGTKQQATFYTLGALLTYCASPVLPDGSRKFIHEDFLDGIWASCYHDYVLPNTSKAEMLLEAHIFEKLKLGEFVTSLHLSRQQLPEETAWTQQQWDTIVNNAATWCKRSKIGLVLIN